MGEWITQAGKRRCREEAVVNSDLIARAQAGDEEAFRRLVDRHRRELHVHCYRILGSIEDAEDQVQETFLAAWHGIAGFEARASVRAWLFRIATNRCLGALRAARRRPAVPAAPPPGLPEPTSSSEVIWLQPYPDVLLEELPEPAPGPEGRYQAREAISLAFVTALQLLPPRQRAVLVLRDVLGFRSREVAAMLDSSEDSVSSALKHARANLRRRLPSPADPPPCPARPPNGRSSNVSPGPTRPQTLMRWSPCSPTMPSSLRRWHLWPTKGGPPPAASCGPGSSATAGPTGSSPPGPTGSPPYL